jgi:hypothetical protein
VAVLVLVALGAVLLLWQRPWQDSDDGAVDIPANAASVLTQQFRTLSDARSEAEFVAAAGSTAGAKAFARQVWAAREALGASGVELRYLRGGDVADRVDGSAEASVEVSWRPGGQSGLAGTSLRTSSVLFRVAPQKNGRFAIGSVRPGEGALPLWLAGKLTVERREGAVVVRVDGGDPQLPVDSMAETARAAVARVVPGTKGALTIVSPRTQSQMARLVGRDIKEIAQIAAVTTTLDGRSGTSAGTVILLNPAVFATMDRRAAQVVLSHEATHLFTGAVGSGAESWVIEGFADFVALHDDSAPLSLSAGQVLGEVKAGKGPTHLPTASDFGSTQHGLGAVYESAWMIFRMLGHRYGDARVVAFYESVLHGTRTDAALRSSFGVTTKQLTAQWRAYLTKSASTVS